VEMLLCCVALPFSSFPARCGWITETRIPQGSSGSLVTADDSDCLSVVLLGELWENLCVRRGLGVLFLAQRRSTGQSWIGLWVWRGCWWMLGRVLKGKV
jgi:hypothetical protein